MSKFVARSRLVDFLGRMSDILLFLLLLPPILAYSALLAIFARKRGTAGPAWGSPGSKPT